MVKIITLIFILILNISTSYCNLSAHYLFDENGQLNTAVLSIIKEATGYVPRTLAEAVEITQKHWLRKPGSERWEIDNNTEVEHKASALLPLFKKIGLIAPIKPSQKKYDYALVMGASTPVVIERLKNLDDTIKDGIAIGTIILLTGDRDLTQQEKDLLNKEFPLKLAGLQRETEYDMMREIFYHTTLLTHCETLWTDCKSFIPSKIINAPKQQLPDGSLRRPNTADTLIEWLKEKPSPGSCLVISSQPYVGYQDSVVRTCLGKDFIVESIGNTIKPNSIALYLDTLARWLYQEHQRQIKK